MDRCCKGCVRGDTPGENVRVAIEKSLSAFDTRGSRKVTAFLLPLSYGSPFDVSSPSSKKDGSAKGSTKSPEAPASGYFEFANKLNLFCCIKVLMGTDGSDIATLWEVPRPSYTAVPPNGLVCGRFDASLPHIEVIVLMGNPTTSDMGEVVYDSAQSPGKVSKAAAVGNFRRYMAFRVESNGKNVMLKFKGDTLLEPRLGNSIGRVGIFGKLGMKSEPDTKDVINFDTNVTAAAIKLTSTM